MAKITKDLKSIITGVLLGDGHLETQNGRTWRLKIEQSIKKKKYVDWLYEKLRDFVSTPPKKKRKKIGEKIYLNYGFSTVYCGNLRFFGQQFYSAGKKRIPKIIKRLLTPLALAVWFMDDGSKKSNRHYGFIFHTLDFPKSQLKLLQKALKENYGIESRIHCQRKYTKVRYRLYIPGREREKFLKVIKPYLLPLFWYKVKK